MNKNVSSFAKNVFYAVGANLSRIFANLVLTLFLPKILSVEGYSYWQLFHFYATYLLYSTLGWTEGLYMKYGGVPWDKLNPKRMSGQIWGVVVHEVVFGCLVLGIGWRLIPPLDVKRLLLVDAVLYMIFHVLLSQLQAVLQASNRIEDYARTYSGERILFLAAAVGCVAVARVSYQTFIVVEILTNLLFAGYAMVLCKRLVMVRPLPLRETWGEKWELIRIGCSVSMASLMGQMIIGVVRFGVELRYGTIAFGKLSLAFSMANMAVTCVTAVSIVIFPALKRLQQKKARELYLPVRDLMTFLMFGVLLAYAPLQAILTLWLPEYGDSIRYLAVLLPFCIYETRNSVLTCTYLKVWMAQKYILYANVLTLLISFGMTWITVFVWGSIDLAAVSIMVLYGIKTILTEQAVKRYLPVRFGVFNLQEMVLTVIFILMSWFLPSVWAWCGYLLCYGLYLLAGRHRLKTAFQVMKEMVQ